MDTAFDMIVDGIKDLAVRFLEENPEIFCKGVTLCKLSRNASKKSCRRLYKTGYFRILVQKSWGWLLRNGNRSNKRFSVYNARTLFLVVPIQHTRVDKLCKSIRSEWVFHNESNCQHKQT
jgi:hypothetical protein